MLACCRKGFVGQVELVQFSREQYLWHDDGSNGRPIEACRQQMSSKKHLHFTTCRRIQLQFYAAEFLIERSIDFYALKTKMRPGLQQHFGLPCKPWQN